MGSEMCIRDRREFNDAKTNVQKEINEGMREKDNQQAQASATKTETVNN